MSLQGTERPGLRVRSGAIDFLRILGLGAVVVGHVWDGGIFALTFYPWHVPLFFFLTGYLLKPGRSVGEEFKKRFVTLVIPYIAWFAIISTGRIIILLIADEWDPMMIIRPAYGGFYAQRPYSAFWFVSALFFAAIIYRLLEKLPQWLQWTLVSFSVVATYFVGDLIAITPLSIGTAVPCLIFVLAGRQFGLWRSKITRPVLVGSVTILMCAVLVAFGISRVLNIKLGNFGTPVLGVVVALAICASQVLIAETLLPKAGEKFNRGVINVAAGGMMVVLSHAAVLQLLETPKYGSWYDLVLALIVPWVLALLVIRTPLAPILAGVPQRKKFSANNHTMRR